MKYIYIDDKNKIKISWNKFFEDLNRSSSFESVIDSENYYDVIKSIFLSLFENKKIILKDKVFDKINESKRIKTHLNNTYPTDLSQLVNYVKNKSNWDIGLYTSGTTNVPKPVTHDFSSINRFLIMEESHSNDIWGLAYNPTHIAGIQVIFQSILNGNTMVRLFGLSQHKALESIRNNKISHISATPTFYRMNLPSKKKLKSVIRVSSGGEPFDEMLKKNIIKTFPNAVIKNIYASTEYGTLFASDGEYFSISKKMREKVRIKSNQIEVHKSLVKLNDTEHENNWYQTGDMVEFSNSDNKFKIIGRDSDLINVGGLIVNLSEIEKEVLKLESISQCRVIAKKNKLIGNLLVCEVVVNSDKINSAIIFKYLSKIFPKYKIPRIINIVDSLKITNTGKIKKL